ncbi:hypothetical protein [Endozoicomonas atrinae]|nr:hypothetical protein [Endozoicomonas atrinae]
MIVHTFPLDQIAQAQEVFLQKRHTGKIVLSVTEK